jgi:hypothetical protein
MEYGNYEGRERVEIEELSERAMLNFHINPDL